MAVTDGAEILWAAHSERYSKIKNDQYLNWEIVKEAMAYGPFDKVVYYEKPWLKKWRQLKAGQYKHAFDPRELPSIYLRKFNIKITDYAQHHHSHMAGGYYTAPFDDANILTVDSIGELETMTLWDNEKLIGRQNYPISLGLLYSAVTQRIGLKPNEEEYITMGMAAYGKPKYASFMKEHWLKRNNHRGVPKDDIKLATDYDLAASVQKVYEDELKKIVVKHCKKINLVLSGGCALNCVANSNLKRNIWIMPNPGDSGSALGCIPAITKQRLNWKGPFLGTNIEGEYPIDSIIKELKENKMVGVANGRAEFGPRALGNRSLLADPRGDDVKDMVNVIKRRQKFRPFAPAILQEDVHDYFDMPQETSPYMQFVGKCKFPKEFPAIIHADGTSRVQTVTKEDNEGFYNLLKEWKRQTGCPILLNTSLNIKGKPMVNDRKDGNDFERKYNVKVV
jgi:carbamoyltransferase